MTTVAAPPRIPQLTCRTVDPDYYHPVGKGLTGMEAYVAHLCRECPIQPACLQMGLESGSSGIWGGVRLYGDSRDRKPKLH